MLLSCPERPQSWNLPIEKVKKRQGDEDAWQYDPETISKVEAEVK